MLLNNKNNTAIDLQSNTQDVLFYAQNGCVLVNANVIFNGALIGEQVKMENNTTVNYDQNLSKARFLLTDISNLTKSGPWVTNLFTEY